MSDLRDKLRIGKHYSMERFGIMTAMAMVLVFGLVIWGAVNTYRDNRTRELTQVIYEGEFATSATNMPGSLLGVFENERRDHAALLFYFGNMGSLSNQAADYSAQIYGMKDEMNLKPTEQPISGGSCAIYGNSGYMVVTLDSKEPFARELLQVMIGENNPKIPDARRTGNETRGDVYDIWYVIVNLGGDGAYMTTSFADDGSFDFNHFFQEIVIARSEDGIRGDLDADLAQLSDALDAIILAERRAEGDGISVADFRPAWVDGDFVSVDDNGNRALNTRTVALGGFDFDWRGGSVSDGYISRLAYAAGFDDVNEYLSTQIASQQPWEYEVPRWTLPDGTVVVRGKDAAVSSSMQDLAADVDALDAAYKAYAKLKNKYQIDDLTRLLQLELDASDRGSVFTSNTDNFLGAVS